MAKQESSAITEFINAQTQQPIMGGFDEAMSQEAELILRNRVASSSYARRQKLPPLPQPRPSLPPPRGPQGTPGPTWTQPAPAAPPQPKFRAVGTMPPPLPQGRDVMRRTQRAAAPPMPPMPRPVVRAPSHLEIPPELETARPAPEPRHAPARPVPPIEIEDTWFDAEPLDVDLSGFESDDIDIPIDDTRAVPRSGRGTTIALLFGGFAVAAAAGVGAYIAMSGPGVDKTSSAPAASVAGAASGNNGARDSATSRAASDTPGVQPAGEERVADQWKAAIASDAEAVAPIHAVATPLENQVELVTEPAGAMLTLIDDGEPKVLGPSPAVASLQDGHSYEIMVTHPGYATILQPVEVGAATVTVALLADGPTLEEALAALPEEEVAAAEVEAEAEPAKTPTRDARRKKAEPSTRTPKVAARDAKKTERAAKRKSEPANKKMGTLMIGTKPPCKIFIDGKNTGLVSPQRNITLKPGKHKVMLVNDKFGIKKTFTVTVKAGEKTRLIRDWSDKIK